MIIRKPAQAWVPAATALAAAAAGLTIVLSPFAALVLLGLVVLAILLLNPLVAVPLVILVSALNRYGYQWGDSQIRVEILVALLLAFVLINRLAVRTVSASSLRSPLVVPLLLYLGANLFSSLVFAHERVRGLKLDAEIFAMVLTFVILIAYLRRKDDIEIALKTLWVVTVGEALVGVVSAGAYLTHLSTYGAGRSDLGPPMVYGTQWEANIFGSFLLGNFFILLADYVGGRRSVFHTLGLFLTVLGILASMTRTVWLGLAIGVVLFSALAVRARRAETGIFPILVALPILALLSLIVGSATPFAQRFLDIVNLQSTSASGRLAMFDVALSEWKRHPIFGLGTGSYNVGAVPGGAHPWLPNLFLLTLHDTGLVGLAILLLLLATFYRYTLKAVSSGGDFSLLAAGSMTGFTMLLLAFQTTTGFWFAYPWIVVAFGMAAARLSRVDT